MAEITVRIPETGVILHFQPGTASDVIERTVRQARGQKEPVTGDPGFAKKAQSILNPPPKGSMGEIALDVAGQAGNRLWKGVQQGAGALGDIGSDARKTGYDIGAFIRHALGLPPAPGAPQIPPGGKLEAGDLKRPEAPEERPSGTMGIGQGGRYSIVPPTSEEIKTLTGYKERKPTTPEGRAFDVLGGSVFELAPSAMFGGEGFAKNFIKYAVVPGMAGGATEMMTRGSKISPLLKTMAEIGSMAATGIGRGKTRMTTEQFEDIGRAKYRELERLGVHVTPQSYDMMVQSATDGLGPGYSAANAPLTAKVLADMQARTGQPIHFLQLDALHKQAIGAAKAASRTNPEDAGMAMRLANKIDDLMGNVTTTDLVAPVGKSYPMRVTRLINEGRSAWKTARNADRITMLIESALDKSVKNFSVAGVQRQLQGDFTQFKWVGGARSRQLSREYQLLPKEQQLAVDYIIAGKPKSLRWLGKFNVNGPMATILSIGVGGALGGTVGAVTGGPLGAVGGAGVGAWAFPAVGQGAHVLSSQHALRRARRIQSDLLGGRKSLGYTMPGFLPFQAPYAGYQELRNPDDDLTGGALGIPKQRPQFDLGQ